MLREVIDERSPAVVRGFRHRGHHHVSRIESFSDAVFGFSLTLLVVSLQVPQSFADLTATMTSFPGFAASFWLLANIWFQQYRFFRRYAMEDSTTIWLNIALLFIIVFFTYPLKFLFRLVFSSTASNLRPGDVLPLYGIFDSGYGAVFVIFLLLHVHALRRRSSLELTAIEVFDTKASIGRHAFSIGVACISFSVVAVSCAAHAYTVGLVLGGWVYPIFFGIGMTAWGFIAGAKRRRYEADLPMDPKATVPRHAS